MGVFCGEAAMLYFVARGIVVVVLGVVNVGMVVVVVLFVNRP
jgi:hypothetical protein